MDIYISSETEEISINNHSVKGLANGINVIVFDMQQEKIIDTISFDETLKTFTTLTRIVTNSL